MSTDIIKADFEQFDENKLDEYMKRTKESYGETDAWKEFEQKNKHRSPKDNIQRRNLEENQTDQQ